MTASILEQLKLKLNASTDSELARKLGVDRRTVSGWRARGSVPKRYLGIIDGASKNAYSAPPEIWGEYEQVAFRLALLRFGNFYQEQFVDFDYRALLAEFPICAAGFWLLMSKAQTDLAREMDEGARNLEVAFAILAHDDLSNVSASVERDKASLAMLKTKSDQ